MQGAMLRKQGSETFLHLKNCIWKIKYVTARKGFPQCFVYSLMCFVFVSSEERSDAASSNGGVVLSQFPCQLGIYLKE